MGTPETSRRPSAPPLTHYAIVGAERNGRLIRALCGKWLRPGEHADAPTCERCQQAIVRLDAMEF